jgi:beta-galactosidase
MSSNTSKSRVRLSLNGIWQLQPGEKTLPPTTWTHEVQVPALVDAATPPYDAHTFQYHWYRRSIAVPEAWRHDLAFLVLDQAMFGTEVWLNGWRVGGDIACYTSQHYDIRGSLRFGHPNELLVRVGARQTLPPESAVGKDQERASFIPGIWGDVNLILCGNPRVSWVQTLPHCERGIVEIRVWVENKSVERKIVAVSTCVHEKESGVEASQTIDLPASIEPGSEIAITFVHAVRNARHWSPEDPFLYEVASSVVFEGTLVDRMRTTFGMREFTVRDGEFQLNGKRIFLRGGNIAFHRFLSDAERGVLPWDPGWIKKALIDIPRASNFNFFRAHLGQMYNLWYDIADACGMLLQNEWQFWTTTGTRDQITREFTQWLRDNWNHPSIVVWDALNESTDPVVQEEIIPEMKQLDPTRPWESVDFVEDHPYIYSLGPVLHDRQFGFSRSLDALERSATPAVVNEFLWWWLDKDDAPTSLMSGVLERWLGRDPSREDVERHQSFLARELVEQFRRMRLDAIQPFVYLSNSAGPTGHWFQGPIRDLTPKPIIEALKDAFAPFGLSLEVWDRHYFEGEHRAFQLYVFNDEREVSEGTVKYGVTTPDGTWLTSKTATVTVEAGELSILPIIVGMPLDPGEYSLCAELLRGDESAQQVVSVSKKHIIVFSPVQPSLFIQGAPIGVLEDGNEIVTFLSQKDVQPVSLQGFAIEKCRCVLVGEGAVRSAQYRTRIAEWGRYVKAGGSLVVLEPEYGVDRSVTVRVLEGLDLHIERRPDVDRGGYDSYVFAEDQSHPLWEEIAREHLKVFNGALGGEMVSQHDVTAGVPYTVHARCGLHLSTVAVAEFKYGGGKVFISRIQVRGRLNGAADGDTLFGRRKDPVAQRYLLNLIGWATQSL